MPYNSETGAYERRTATVIDATPDGDTVAVAIDDKLDLAADDAVLDLNHHAENGNHYPATGAATNSRYLRQSPAGVVAWANGVPIGDAVESALLADTGGSALVGHTTGTVKGGLDARPTSATLAASGGAALVGYSDGRTVEAAIIPDNPDKVGFWTDYGGAKIRKIRDRLFVGDAAGYTGAYGTTDNPFSPIPRWVARESSLVVGNSVGRNAITGITKTSLGVDDPSGSPTYADAAIGVIGVAANDYTGATSRRTWGGYFESWRAENCVNAAFGVEIDIGNNHVDHSNTPFSEFGAGTFGLTVASGGSKGSAYANPATAAIIIANNTQTFNKGIVFGHDSITGADGTTGNGIAIAMAKGHSVGWYTSDGQLSSQIFSNVAASANRVNLEFTDNIVRPLGVGGNALATFENVASSANYARLITAASGASPEIRAGGSDTDIDLRLNGKGAGVVRFGAWASNADAAVNGYVTIKDAAGTTRKLATIA